MSKFTADRIPRMKAKKKAPKKLGLLTPKRRVNMTMRLSNETIERLEELLKVYRVDINHKVSRTDIIEALIKDAIDKRSNNELKRVLLEWGSPE